MHVHQEEEAAHEQGESSTEEECRIQIPRLGQWDPIRTGEMEQAEKAEEDAGDEDGHAYCSVHRQGLLQ